MLIPIPANLIATTTTIIYIGCHRSLRLRERAQLGGGAGDGAAAVEHELISTADAYKFPFVGSAVLFGLYALFKLFDKELVNLLLSVYFSALGAYTLAASAEPALGALCESRAARGAAAGERGAAAAAARLAARASAPLVDLGERRLPFGLGAVHPRASALALLCWAGALALAAAYFRTKHWLLNNLFGISFCVQGMERISLGSFKVGAILLGGLFFYDIFWVFGSEVMVTVAKSFDAPIKLLFPRAFADKATGAKAEARAARARAPRARAATTLLSCGCY